MNPITIPICLYLFFTPTQGFIIILTTPTSFTCGIPNLGAVGHPTIMGIPPQEDVEFEEDVVKWVREVQL
jgi:hypothetical protein